MFKYKCCRCGFCCLSASCPMAMRIFGVRKEEPCPGLSFDGDMAYCNLHRLPNMGIGAGCCISARAYHGDEVYDFAGLPPEAKIGLAKILRERKGDLCLGSYINSQKQK